MDNKNQTQDSKYFRSSLRNLRRVTGISSAEKGSKPYDFCSVSVSTEHLSKVIADAKKAGKSQIDFTLNWDESNLLRAELKRLDPSNPLVQPRAKKPTTVPTEASAPAEGDVPAAPADDTVSTAGGQGGY